MGKQGIQRFVIRELFTPGLLPVSLFPQHCPALVSPDLLNFAILANVQLIENLGLNIEEWRFAELLLDAVADIAGDGGLLS